MILPDVNILLYAHITAYPVHARARAWWEATLRGNERVALTDVAIFGFVRLATNRRVFELPMTVEEAASAVEGWFATPAVFFLVPDPSHVATGLGLLRALGAGANLTTDIQLAAYALGSGATLATTDSDFARMPGVRCVNPVR